MNELGWAALSATTAVAVIAVAVAVVAVRAARKATESAGSLEALRVRVRVADEIAGRHRRNAETASAGMFELLSGLVEAEEGARGQLAAELHDTVAQSLMRARSLLGAEPGSPDHARLTDAVSEAEEQIRGVMARTRPPALRDGDLAQAVSDLCDDLDRRYGLAVELTWPAEPVPLPMATAVTVYRFFQEALLNVVKHAETDQARGWLVIDAASARAGVRDDGVGFDPSGVRADHGRHVGLGLLRERARLAGGTLQVDAGDGTGTQLEVELPIGAGNVARQGGRLPSVVSREDLRTGAAT